MVQPQGGLPGDCSVAVEDCAANPGRPRCWRGSPEAHHRRVGSRTASTSSEESPSRPQAPAAAGGEPFSALFRWLRTSQWRCDAKGNEGYHAIFPNISVAFPKFYCDRLQDEDLGRRSARAPAYRRSTSILARFSKVAPRHELRVERAHHDGRLPARRPTRRPLERPGQGAACPSLFALRSTLRICLQG